MNWSNSSWINLVHARSLRIDPGVCETFWWFMDHSCSWLGCEKGLLSRDYSSFVLMCSIDLFCQIDKSLTLIYSLFSHGFLVDVRVKFYLSFVLMSPISNKMNYLYGFILFNISLICLLVLKSTYKLQGFNLVGNTMISYTSSFKIH